MSHITLRSNLDRLHSFLQNKPGWKFGKGGCLPTTTYCTVIHLLCQFEKQGISMPCIFMNADPDQFENRAYITIESKHWDTFCLKIDEEIIYLIHYESDTSTPTTYHECIQYICTANAHA